MDFTGFGTTACKCKLVSIRELCFNADESNCLVTSSALTSGNNCGTPETNLFAINQTPVSGNTYDYAIVFFPGDPLNAQIFAELQAGKVLVINVTQTVDATPTGTFVIGGAGMGNLQQVSQNGSEGISFQQVYDPVTCTAINNLYAGNAVIDRSEVCAYEIVSHEELQGGEQKFRYLVYDCDGEIKTEWQVFVNGEWQEIGEQDVPDQVKQLVCDSAAVPEWTAGIQNADYINKTDDATLPSGAYYLSIKITDLRPNRKIKINGEEYSFGREYHRDVRTNLVEKIQDFVEEVQVESNGTQYAISVSYPSNHPVDLTTI